MMWLVLFSAVALFAASCFGGGRGEQDIPSGIARCVGNSDEGTEGRSLGVTRGDIAQDFTVYDVDGNPVNFSDFRGQCVFLNFWASWCPPCREEMPTMEELYQDRKDELAMLAVSFPVGPETEEKARRFFFVEHNFSFIFLYDRDDVIERGYRVFNIPMTYLIRPNGVISAVIVGSRDWTGKGCQKLMNAFMQDEMREEGKSLELIGGCSEGFGLR